MESGVNLVLVKVQTNQDGWQRVISCGDELKIRLENFIASTMRELSIPLPLVEWCNFYRDEFGIELNLSNLVIPLKREGCDCLLIIASGITIEQVFQKCKSKFGAWKCTDTDLDQAVPTNDRTNSETYAIWVRDRQKADEELMNKSANQLAQEKIPGITLLERLIYELKYFKETGKHLDINSWALCSGSRYTGGDVPSVFWSDVKLVVYWADVDGADDCLHSREVVS